MDHSVDVPTCECGVEDGQLHEFGCRFEDCPFCEERLSMCDCMYEFLGLRTRSNPPENNWLDETTYKYGVTPEHEDRWLSILTTKGRMPFTDAPQICGRCGDLWPALFMVPDAVWEYYAGPMLRNAIVCETCFHVLRHRIDAHQPRPEWLMSEEDILRYIAAFHAGDKQTLVELDPKRFEPHRPAFPLPSMRPAWVVKRPG